MLLLSSDFKSFTLKSLKLSINNDYVKIIDAFMPELIVAESEKENEIVLSQAMRSFASFALFKPSLGKIGHEKLSNDYQKIFLLDEGSEDVAEFSKHGLVVYTRKDYEKEYKNALNNVL